MIPASEVESAATSSSTETYYVAFEIQPQQGDSDVEQTLQLVSGDFNWKKGAICQFRCQEAKINMSFVNLLYTICLLLPTELKWDSIQRHLDLHIDEAEYPAIVDGGLMDA